MFCFQAHEVAGQEEAIGDRGAITSVSLEADAAARDSGIAKSNSRSLTPPSSVSHTMRSCSTLCTCARVTQSVPRSYSLVIQVMSAL